MSEILIEMAELVASKVGDALEGHAINDMGELTLHVKAEKLVDIVELLKTNQQLKFSTLIDITAVDYPGRAKRFDMVYHFLSMYTNQRVRLKAAVAEDDAKTSGRFLSRLRIKINRSDQAQDAHA